MMNYEIRIEVCGTLTDFLLAHEDGTVQIYEVLSSLTTFIKIGGLDG